MLEWSIVSMSTCPHERKQYCMSASMCAYMYVACLHRCTHTHNDMICTCLHVSNYKCIRIHVCIYKCIYAYIYFFTCACIHVCFSTCMHVFMDTCRCSGSMMRIQKLIGYVGNDEIMHEWLQRCIIIYFSL